MTNRNLNNGLNAWLLGGCVALGALVFYSLTTSPYPVLGMSSSLIVSHTGLTPFAPMTHFVWGWLVRLVMHVPVGTLSLRLHAMSSVCSALALWLFFRHVYRIQFRQTDEAVAPRIHGVCALTATLFFAVSLPFWVVSNRAHTMSLDILMLLIALELYVRYEQGGARWQGALFWLFMGVGCVEFGTFWVFLLPMAFLTLAQMLKWKHFQWKTGGGYLLCFLAGLVLFLPAAVRYYSLPVSEWRGFDSLFQVFWQMARAQWVEIRATVPQRGWLLTFFVAIFPWAVCLWAGRDSRQYKRRIPSALLHAVILLITLMVLYNSFIAPWRMLGGENRLMVTPYLFTAASFGYVCGYWYAVLVRALQRRKPRCEGAVRYMVLALAIGGLGGSVYKNWAEADARYSADLHGWCRHVLRDLSGRPWLITPGLMDNMLLLTAWEARHPLMIVNTRFVREAPYMRYLAESFKDRRLRGLASLGLDPLMQQWARQDSHVEDKVGIIGNGGFWGSIKRYPVPMVTLYLGTARPETVDADALLRSYEGFWEEFLPRLEHLKSSRGAFKRAALLLQNETARMANDLAVFLEEQGQTEQALSVYGKTLEIDPGNISALLNRYVLLRRLGRTAAADELKDQASSALVEVDNLYSLWWLIGRHGRLCDREAIRVAREMVKPAQQLPPEAREKLSQALGFYTQRRYDEAQVLLNELINNGHDVPGVYILRAYAAYQQGDDETLDQCHAAMKAKRTYWPSLLYIMARRADDRQQWLQARQYVDTAVVLQPGNVRILEQGLKLAVQDRDVLRMRQYLKRLLATDPGHAYGNFALGILQFNDNQLDLAEDSLRRSIKRKPMAASLNNLAWILQERGALDEAGFTLDRAMKMHPNDASCRDTLAMIRFRRGDLDGARTAFEQALALDADSADIRLHYAHFLLKQNDPDGARRLIDGLVRPTEFYQARRRTWDAVQALLTNAPPRP